MNDTPIYAALADERPEVPLAMARKPWNYADALAAADKAIILRPMAKPRAVKKPAPVKKSAAARKGSK